MDANLPRRLKSIALGPARHQPRRMSGVLRQCDRVGRFADFREDVYRACTGNFSEDRIHERRSRALTRGFDEFHAFENRCARRNPGEKLQLIHAEAQCGQDLGIQPLGFLRRCGGQPLVEQRPPAENSHYQFGGEPVIARGKL